MDYVIPYDRLCCCAQPISEVRLTLFEATGAGHPGGLHFPAELARHSDPHADGASGDRRHVCAFPLLGFSINLTSMFGLVLAIGSWSTTPSWMVEAVQRHIDDGMAPRDATSAPMQEVCAAGGGDRLHPGGGLHSGGGSLGGISGQILQAICL